MYTVPGGDKILMSTERPYHYTHLLQISKKSLWSLILYNCVHDLIHVYIGAQGQITPKWIIRFDPNSNLFELLCLCSLPASLTKTQSKVTEKSWRHHFFHRWRAGNSKMTSQIRSKFKPVHGFMPVLISCKFDEVWIHSNWRKDGDTIFPIQCQWERSRAYNSVVSGPIWQKFELILDFMHVLVICKYKKYQITNNQEKVETLFSPL